MFLFAFPALAHAHGEQILYAFGFGSIVAMGVAVALKVALLSRLPGVTEAPNLLKILVATTFDFLLLLLCGALVGLDVSETVAYALIFFSYSFLAAISNLPLLGQGGKAPSERPTLGAWITAWILAMIFPVVFALTWLLISRL